MIITTIGQYSCSSTWIFPVSKGVRVLTQSSTRGLFTSTFSNRAIVLTMVAVIAVMMLDVSLARVYDLIAKQPTSLWRITLFASLTAFCIIAHYFILAYVERKSADIKNIAKLRIRTVQRLARISQLAITAVLVILVLQTVTNLIYNTWLMIAIVWISYGLAIIMLGILAQRFFSWSMSNKSRTIILYALASASLSINAGFSLVYVSEVLVDRPEVTMPFAVGSMVSILPNSERAILNSGFFVSSVISFALLWGATAVLLHHYSQKLGAVRYWIIIGSPLALFLGQFASFFVRLFDPLLAADPVSLTIWITLIFTLSKPAGGILFGVAFYTIARNFKQNSVLRNYLIISGFGFVLLYAADHASVLLVAPFPPFGVPTVSFVGLASYLILLGIYSSVISISEDVKLRHLLRRTALDQSHLLDSLASAQIKEEIHKKAITIMKDNSDRLAKVTGLEPAHSEDDLKQYIEEVMKEVNKNKERGSTSKESGNNIGEKDGR